MSSATVVVEVVRVQGSTVDLWAAEVPRGADGAFSSQPGADHPAFGLMVVAGANNWNNALARAIGGADDWARLADDYVSSFELIDVVRFPTWLGPGGTADTLKQRAEQTVEEIWSRPDYKRAVLELAPRALYRVTLKDPSWTAHLSARAVFESTAYSPLPRRGPPTWASLEPDPWLARIDRARERIAGQSGWHLWRSAATRHTPGQVLWRHWENRARLLVSNRVRELWLSYAGLSLACFDAAAPGFKPGKFRFKANTGADPLDIRRLPLRPRGFALGGPSWGDEAERGPDGVARGRLDYLHPDGVAWVDLQGEPLVRVGTLDGVSPDAPTVHLDTYLEAAAQRCERDAGIQ